MIDLEDKKPREYKHKEAFCLMRYESHNGFLIETLWNSRDGVTPFMITNHSGTVEMKHTHWNNDLRKPHHVPQVGDRIFITLTEPLAKKYAEEYIKVHGKRMLTTNSYFQGMTNSDLVEWKYKANMESVEQGQPTVIVVTDEWL